MRLGVLASGTGTILAAILEAGIKVAVVVVDRPCAATTIASDAGIEAVMIQRTSFGQAFDREAYTKQVTAALEEHAIDVAAIAGFGTILSASFCERFEGRVLNTHPSLLPAFKGWHAVDEALAAGVKVTGCTVHVVTAEVDAGPIVAQEAVPVLPGDDAASLHERIKTVERELFPRAIKEFMASVAQP